MLSAVGRVSILEITGQTGWEFGTDLSKRQRSETAKTARTKTLMVSDISKKLDEIAALISEIDVMPKQILIKAKVMEVNRDFLKDIGFDWGTGITGATSNSLEFTSGAGKGGAISLSEMAAKAVIPTAAGFGAKSSGLTDTPKSLQLAYRKLVGTQFEVLLYALEEDGKTKTLSEPVILTLDNQEASILVGTKIPILKTEVSTETNQVSGGSLDYYQDIGIQLNVVPQVSGENDEFINLIIHPAITSSTTNKTLGSATGNFTIASYPIIISREIETQTIIKDGETIVIGGLFKDVKTKYIIGFPLLKDLPFVGKFFRRDTYDDEKIDLMIFLTAKIVKPGELLAQEFMATDNFSAEFKKGYK